MSESLELFIRVDESGDPVDHPIFGDNFRQAFPNVDVNNLPSNFARFVRVQRPTPDVYEVLTSETPAYQLVDGVFTDVWTIRDMTPTEKATKQQAARDAFAEAIGDKAPNFTTWTLDEDTCTMVAPTARPDGEYAWKGATNSWELRAAYPTDGKAYRWDYVTWSWIEVV